LEALVNDYLSERHLGDPQGCVFASLGGQITRCDSRTRDAATQGFEKTVAVVARQLSPLGSDEARRKALVILLTMIGALTMARMVADADLSSEILQRTREHLNDLLVEKLASLFFACSEVVSFFLNVAVSLDNNRNRPPNG
jgi:TetR/AcrR family transcriptional regulator, transcriptional repressor for nem operon